MNTVPAMAAVFILSFLRKFTVSGTIFDGKSAENGGY